MVNLLKGRTTFRRFRVKGDPPNVNGDEFLELLEAHQFRDISSRTDVDEEMGWIGPDHLFDFEFTTEKLVKDPYVILSIRRDRRRIPRKLLKAHCLVEEKGWKDATGQEKVPPDKRKEIRDAVEERLRSETPPTSKAYDAFWNVQEGVLYLCNKSKAVCEGFRDLFRMTFNLDLEHLGPYPVAAEMLDEGQHDRLVETEPTSFAAALI